MDTNVDYVENKRLERVKAALEAHNMQAFIVQQAAEVVPLLQSMLPAGAVVANGGSMTLYETGVMDFLRAGQQLDFLDREAPGIDLQKLYRDVFSADYYFASANAITESGEIYEIDRNCNRIAAIAFGPSHVILVAGRNKIVKDLDAARQRRADIAAPANAKRLSRKTPCATTGQCINCSSPDRICSTELILHQQGTKNRISVILVNQNLGY